MLKVGVQVLQQGVADATVRITSKRRAPTLSSAHFWPLNFGECLELDHGERRHAEELGAVQMEHRSRRSLGA